MQQQILNLQRQVCQFTLDEVWDCAEMLGSYMVIFSAKASSSGLLASLHGAGSHLESLAIYADALKGKGEYKRAIDYYKQALQQRKMFRGGSLSTYPRGATSNSTPGSSSSDNVLNQSSKSPNLNPATASTNPAMFSAEDAAPQDDQQALTVIASATALRSMSKDIGTVEAQIKFQIAKCQVSLGEKHTALKTLETVSSRYKTPSMLVWVGKIYADCSIDRGTLNNYREALRQNAYSLQAAIGLTKLHMKSEDINELCFGSKVYEKEDLAWISKLVEAHGNYASSRHKQALSIFSSLEKWFPNHVHILIQMASLHLQLNDRNAAIVMFQKARAADMKNLEGMDIYASLIRHQEDQTRLNSLTKELLDVNDKRPEAWIAVALFCDLKGDRLSAMRFVDKALELDPNHLTAHHFKGDLYLRLQQPEESVSSYYKAYTLRRDFNAYHGLVNAYLKIPKVAEALRTAKEALSLMPKDARAMLLVGRVLAQTPGDGRKKSIKAYAKALKLDPLCYEAAIAFADLHLIQQQQNPHTDLQPAITIMTQSLQHHNKDFMHSKLGELHTMAMNYSDALTHFHRALSLNVDFEPARQGLERLEKLMRGIDPDMEEETEIEDGENPDYLDQDV